MRIGWWNIEHLSSVWFSDTFWDIPNDYDVIFLTETHHVEVPAHTDWEIFGADQAADAKAGGSLVFVRRRGRAQVFETWIQTDDCVWINLGTTPDSSIWIGGAYVPGPLDKRFRSRQGHGQPNHFDTMSEQLQKLSGQRWILGGDFNSRTSSHQVLWGPADTLDDHVPTMEVPERTSQDKRVLNAHSRRFLCALTDKGFILNGIKAMSFSDRFTRMPQRVQDCPGVIDYVCASPAALLRL